MSVGESNYIIHRDANRFGGNQAHFLETSRTVVESGVSQIKKSIGENGNLQELFSTLLASFVEARRAIALSKHTPDAEYFGLKRINVIGMIESTPLSGVYGEYKDKILSLFEMTLNGSLPQEKTIKADRHLDRSCFFEVEAFSQQEIDRREWNDYIPLQKTDLPNYDKADKLHKTRIQIQQKEASNPIYAPDQQNLKLFNQNLKELKDSYSSFYQHLKMFEILGAIENEYRHAPQPPYNTYLFGKLRIEIDGRKVALSEYFIPTLRSNPIRSMRNYTAIIIHQDRFLIEDLLKEIAIVFERAIRSDSSKLEELKDRAALVRYLFAHAMPYVRGSAAIGEWFEKTIYRFHGYECTYNTRMMGDLEALTSLWSTFRKERYEGTIQLTKVV
jgi:Avirulence protein